MKDAARPGSSGSLDPSGAKGAPGTGDPSRPYGNGEAGSRSQEGSGIQRNATPRRLPDPGERIGAFLLEEHIGAGGMGTVYRARDLCLERQVALKLLPGEIASDPDAVPRFYQEARAAAQLDHENIARIFSIGHDSGYHYIAFEYIEGHTIRQRVQDNGPLPVAETVNYTLQVASALVHASERGVVHRDIKPSNIIITPHGRAKLVDMGLARRIEREGAQANDDPLTQSGMTLGTFDYISPEQAADPRNVDTRSDLYSLGCTMFHMLSGRPPFPDGTVLQKLLQHKEEPPPDVRTVAPEVPGDLAAIILKLMAKDPDRRYQTAEQLERDLITLAGTHGFPAFGPDNLPWPIPRNRPASWERHLIWGLPAVGLAALVALLVWWGQVTDPSVSSPGPVLVAAPPSPSQANGRDTASNPVTIDGDDRPATATRNNADDPADIPESWLVRTDTQLEEALRLATSGSEIVLGEAGPFTLHAQAVAPSSPGAGVRAPRRNLVIRAEPGVRPTIQNAPIPPGTSGDLALLGFGPGRVELSDVTLALDANGLEGSLAALSFHDTEALLRGCAFRRRGNVNPGGRLLAVRTRQESAKGTLPEPLLIEQAHIDPQIQAIGARGPFDGWLRDCTIGASPLTFGFENPAAAVPVPVRLGLAQCSLMPADGVVFRFSDSRASIRVDHSVIAPALAVETTLVAIDNPSNLTWIGRDNRYARIRAFLQPSSENGAGEAVVRRFDVWAADDAISRELDSQYGGPLWEEADPLAALAADPNPAFRLADGSDSPWGLGAQRGAFGPIHGLSVAATAPPDTSEGPVTGRGTPALPRDPAEPTTDTDPAATDTMPEPMLVAREAPEGATMPSGEVEGAPSSVSEQPFELGMESFPNLPGTERPVPKDRAPNVNAGDPDRNPLSDPGATPRVVSGGAAGTGELTTSDELRRALSGHVATDERIDLASDREFDLAAIRLAGPGRRVVQGRVSPDGKRPLVRFTPCDGMSPDDELARRTWLTIDGGTVELRHLDLVMDAGDTIASLFVLPPGAQLRLIDCSVTLEGPAAAGSALFQTQPESTVPGGDEEDSGRPPSSVVVEVQDSLLRAGTDIFLGQHAGDWRISLTESVVAGSGAFFRLEPGADDDNDEDDAHAGELALDLERSALRCNGGLLLVRALPGPFSMPHVAVTARRSILSAPSGGEPLIRVEGPDRIDEAGPWLDWQGDGVVYDGFVVYRRDTSTTPGSVPQLFNRADWELAVAGRDRVPFHGRVIYAQASGNPSPPWRLRPGQLQPSPDSPASDAGPDFRRIPPPPG